MSNVILTIGDSFTYGEALQFHLWKESYPNTFAKFKNKQSYEPCQTISSDFNEFDLFRKEHNYTGHLSNILGVKYVSNSGNGGSNISSLETLDKWIEHIKIEKQLTPILCVFQLTHIVRDVMHVQHMNNPQNSIFKDVYELVKTILVSIQNINSPTEFEKQNMKDVFCKLFEVIVLEIKKRFSILEEQFGTKCLFLVGSAEEYSKIFYHDIVKDDKNYLPIIYNDIVYSDWNTMNKDIKWTIRESIGVSDDHPNLESHQWLSNQIYKKYLEISN
jgi:hypothetical protein